MNRLLMATFVAAALVVGCEDEPTPVVCFVGGTRIATPSGAVAVETLHEGDEVVCVDPRTGHGSIGRVRKLRVAEVSEHVVVSTADGQRVAVTQHHPFWDPNAGAFREIGDFVVGDELLAWAGGAPMSTRITVLKVLGGVVTVYHPEVEGPPHTFVAAGLVVHNKPPALPDPVRVTLRVEPDGSGWISFPGGFVGQGADTVFFLQEQSSPSLEAVPRVGWAFDHWEGDVSATDTFVVYMDVREGSRAVCFFAPQP